MTLGEAVTICKEMQMWRRSEPPYDGDTPETHKEQPYSSQAFGLAVDLLIGLEETLDELQERVNKVEARNKEMIDKACEWLESHFRDIENPDFYSKRYHPTDLESMYHWSVKELVDDFRKAMEE